MDGLDSDGLTFFLENRRMEKECSSVPSMVVYSIWVDMANLVNESKTIDDYRLPVRVAFVRKRDKCCGPEI